MKKTSSKRPASTSKQPHKALEKKVHALVDRIKASHQPVFSIMPNRRGMYDVTKLTRKAIREMGNLKRKRDKFIKGLEEVCRQVIVDFNPLQQMDMPARLAVRAVAHRLCQNRSKYLAKGKLIPGWFGPLEYQFRAMTALLLLLEPFYDDDARRPAQTRGNKSKRR